MDLPGVWTMAMTLHEKSKILPEPNRTGICWTVFFQLVDPSIHPSIHPSIWPDVHHVNSYLNWLGDVLLTQLLLN